MKIPDEIVIDPERLTIGELEEMEDYAGAAATAAALKGDLSPKALVMIAFFSLRRTHPEITLEDVRDIPLVRFKPVEPADSAKAAKSDAGNPTDASAF
ncbi:MAG: hypothetical protein ACRDH9_05385 [Actinomycetota bacterium]